MCSKKKLMNKKSASGQWSVYYNELLIGRTLSRSAGFVYVVLLFFSVFFFLPVRDVGRPIYIITTIRIYKFSVDGSCSLNQ